MDAKSNPVEKPYNPYDEEEPTFVNKIYVDLNMNEEIPKENLMDASKSTNLQNLRVQQCDVFCALNSGFIVHYQLEDFLNQHLRFLPHANNRPNYNPSRVASEDFVQQI